MANKRSHGPFLESAAGLSVRNVLETVAAKRILFGHQSVGAGIVEGAGDLCREFPDIALRLIESRSPVALSVSGFCHFRVGRNTDPESKIADFERLMNDGFGERADAAFFKFCYVDIHGKSDIARIFRVYNASMERLKQRHRRVRFVQVTVPVVAESGSAAVFVGRLLGRRDTRKEDNAARGRFNESLMRRYRGSDPVFDLATIQSGTVPSGADGVDLRPRVGEPLSTDYTDDGSHLNPRGRRAVAEALMAFISRLDGVGV